MRRFVEKPSADVAADYLASGDYRWNAGMFVVRPGVLLDLLAGAAPGVRGGSLRAIAADPAAAGGGLAVAAADLPRPRRRRARGRRPAGWPWCPAAFGWDDIGDFASLAALLGAGAAGLAVLGDPALVRALDATGLVVPAAGRTIAVVGLDDVVVVDTRDALLVTTTARAQDVKAIVEGLTASGDLDLT